MLPRGPRLGLHRSTSQRRTPVSASVQRDAPAWLEQRKSESLSRPLYKDALTTPSSPPKRGEGQMSPSTGLQKYSPVHRPRYISVLTSRPQDSPACTSRN